MSDDVYNALDSFSVNIKVLRYMGLWLPKQNDKHRTLYLLYSFFIIGVFYSSFVVGQAIYFIQNWGDVEEMVQGLFLTVTVVGEYFKILPFLLRSKHFLQLLAKIHCERFQPRTEKHKEMLKVTVKSIKWNCKAFTALCTGTVMIWSIFPLVGNAQIETESYVLPMKSWFPFSTTKSPNYQIAYIYLSSGIMVSAIINPVFDTLVLGLIMHANMQLDILSDILNNIKSKECTTEEERTFQEETFQSEIKHCIQRHVHIIRFVADVERTFQYTTMTTFGSNAFVITVTLFKLTLLPFSLELFTMASYMNCIMIEMYMFCWYGNELTLKSIKVTNAAYNSDWHICGNQSYRKTLLLLMTRLRRPIQIKAAKFIPLSVETYTTVLRTCWSYYVMLRQLHDQQKAS